MSASVGTIRPPASISVRWVTAPPAVANRCATRTSASVSRPQYSSSDARSIVASRPPASPGRWPRGRPPARRGRPGPPSSRAWSSSASTVGSTVLSEYEPFSAGCVVVVAREAQQVDQPAGDGVQRRREVGQHGRHLHEPPLLEVVVDEDGALVAERRRAAPRRPRASGASPLVSRNSRCADARRAAPPRGTTTGRRPAGTGSCRPRPAPRTAPSRSRGSTAGTAASRGTPWRPGRARRARGPAASAQAPSASRSSAGPQRDLALLPLAEGR